jgi:hypothetical protein
MLISVDIFVDSHIWTYVHMSIHIFMYILTYIYIYIYIIKEIKSTSFSHIKYIWISDCLLISLITYLFFTICIYLYIYLSIKICVFIIQYHTQLHIDTYKYYQYSPISLTFESPGIFLRHAAISSLLSNCTFCHGGQRNLWIDNASHYIHAIHITNCDGWYKSLKRNSINTYFNVWIHSDICISYMRTVFMHLCFISL